MLQKFMDGKKKYSAFIITVLATMIPMFIQEPEAQQTFMDMVPSVAAALAGIFYIITQGKIDREKEAVKAVNGNGAVVTTQTLTQTAAAQPQAEIQPVVEEVQPFDVKGFHETVLAEVEATYKEVNPATIYYKARDKGTVTACQSISQAQDYWSYLVDLAVDARDWLKGETEKAAGACGRSPEYYVFTRDFNSTIRAANALNELAISKVDWKSKLMSFQWKLYTLGVLAEQLQLSS